jgi:non-specific serine/threonine protein kinase/serine/threonine-protein kinase
VLNNLGMLLMHQGKMAEAESLLRQALEGKRRLVGNDHFSTLTALNNLGTLLANQGKFEEAEAFLRESFDGYRRVLGEDNISTQQTQISLGALKRRQGDLDAAEQIFADAVSRVRKLPAADTLLVSALRRQGRCLVEMRRFAEAEGPLLEAYELASTLNGKDAERSIGYLIRLYTDWGKPAQVAEWQARSEALANPPG